MVTRSMPRGATPVVDINMYSELRANVYICMRREMKNALFYQMCTSAMLNWSMTISPRVFAVPLDLTLS